MHQCVSRAFWVLGGVALLTACGGGDAPAPATTPATPPPSAAAAAAAEAEPTPPVESRPAASIEQAEAALRAQRSFAPAGDNAFELFIEILEADPDLQRARDAITDLFPYAVLHVEQRVLANDADEARRVLELMRRAQPQAPALDRLERNLERVERRVEAERAAQAAQAARAAAAAAAAAPPVAAPPPVPEPVPQPDPEPEPEPTPPPQPEPQPATPPPPAAPAAATPPPGPITPRAVNLPAPNYPTQAARQGQEGEVTLEFTINPDGSVSDISVLSARPRGVFDREAINAIRRSSYEPLPEPVRVRRTIEFTMGR